MNRTFALSLALLAASAAGLRAQFAPAAADPSDGSEKIRYELILPEEKAPEVVKPSEPNPFSKADTHIIKEDGASGEENRVREILSNLPITGYADSRGNGLDARIMIGPMKLRRGDIVPSVLADQSVRLRVNAISREQVDLVWIEKKKSTGMPPRVVTLQVHVTSPKVRRELPTLPVAAPDAGKKGGGNFIYQGARNPDNDMPPTDPSHPPETRRATAADSSPPPSPAAGAPDVKSDPEHPANLLMNLLFKSASKPVEAPPPAPSK